ALIPLTLVACAWGLSYRRAAHVLFFANSGCVQAASFRDGSSTWLSTNRSAGARHAWTVRFQLDPVPPPPPTGPPPMCTLGWSPPPPPLTLADRWRLFTGRSWSLDDSIARITFDDYDGVDAAGFAIA